MSTDVDWVGIGVLFLIALTVELGLVFAFVIWRHGYARGWRAARSSAPACPACPACGYSLVGLTACRCPECGRTYKLDELWEAPLFGRRKGVQSDRSGTPRSAGAPGSDEAAADNQTTVL